MDDSIQLPFAKRFVDDYMTRISFPDRSNHQPPPKRERKVKGMRRNTPKRAKHDREAAPERAKFLEQVGVCMIEGCNKPAVECHEIARGNAREAALKLPRLQMALCARCHVKMDDYSKWPPEKQLAHRALWELQQMANEFNQARGRAPTAFTLEELLGRMMFRRRKR